MKVVGSEAGKLVTGARQAVQSLRRLSAADKNRLLFELAEQLVGQRRQILDANAQDVASAAAMAQSPAALDRLRLTPQRLDGMVQSVRLVAQLEDPVGAITEVSRQPNGMMVGQMRVPIGVILMIYEARPNVTVDAGALCVKAGNAVILRGGSEALRSNIALGNAFAEAGFPAGAVQVVEDPDRALVTDLLSNDGIDLTIPRGSEQLIRVVAEHARMPVLKHFKGVCHLFVDRDADPMMAEKIVLNAKTQRPSTCNALETLLVDRPAAPAVLPGLLRMLQEAGVEVRGDEETCQYDRHAVAATDADWAAEYLDLILAVRIVDGLDEALAHIQRYSTGLADGIITEHHARAMKFVEMVDSAAVLVNASTRLVDGAELGLGAEIGISTDRIGPRGPMGLKELTTLKWVVLGSGQVRE
jgi:glutamate-5-semialdehyde dehydrogenase